MIFENEESNTHIMKCDSCKKELDYKGAIPELVHKAEESEWQVIFSIFTAVICYCPECCEKRR